MIDSWRLRIEHKTGYDYAGPVSSSYNRYEDYWGTVVTSFDVHARHESLTVTATSTVETLPAGDLIEASSWSDDVDRWYEFVLPTKRTRLDDSLAATAAEIKAAHATPHAAARAVCDFVRREVAYQPGATGVQSDALHAWAQRKGVCQDISHLTIALVREMGVPARYVSGYLHPKPSAEVGESVVGQSHAWVEWWAGRWTAFDPTNGVPVGERHVVVGRGREYGDVPPLKGVYAGPASTGQGVEVTITRLR
jgi:transglutaminase-like putative cysteine protease